MTGILDFIPFFLRHPLWTITNAKALLFLAEGLDTTNDHVDLWLLYYLLFLLAH
jgi:hypothetical protein